MQVDDDNDILDPAHADDGGRETVVAGLPGTENKDGQPAPKVSADGNIVEIGDKKYITQAALAQEREEKQRLAKILEDLDPVMPEFEEFLRTRQTRTEQTRDRVARDGKQATDDQEYLQDVAVALGFYNEQNQPDLRRAQAHLNITRKEAERAAGSAVRPLAERTTRDQASVNREKARSAKFADGQPVAAPEYMDRALQALPDEYLADPNVANITQVIAAGLEYLDMRRNGTLSRGSGGRGGREPMFVERGAGRVGNDDGGISDFDRAAARARGKSPEQWAKLTKQLNPDRGRRGGTVLEEV